ncbi:hypothetical protein, partial [Acinetobacter sp. c3-l95]|uniref:hypothetical protein n=1 Tax=Acinetobacter sp. c3-l95 TaxID=3342804 RepID=UPI0035BB40C5
AVAKALDCFVSHLVIISKLSQEVYYVKSQLCMERKGYKDNSLPRGVCYRYADSQACKLN